MTFVKLALKILILSFYRWLSSLPRFQDSLLLNHSEFYLPVVGVTFSMSVLKIIENVSLHTRMSLYINLSKLEFASRSTSRSTCTTGVTSFAWLLCIGGWFYGAFVAHFEQITDPVICYRVMFANWALVSSIQEHLWHWDYHIYIWFNGCRHWTSYCFSTFVFHSFANSVVIVIGH